MFTARAAGRMALAVGRRGLAPRAGVAWGMVTISHRTMSSKSAKTPLSPPGHVARGSVLSPCDQFALKRDALVDRGGQRAVSSSAKSSSAKDVLSAGCCGGADEDDEAPPCAQPLPFDKIAIIGAGVMSNVIVSRIVNCASQKCPAISIYDVNHPQAAAMAELYDGVSAEESSADALSGASLIILAVKPQNINSVAKQILAAGPRVSQDAVLLSVLAGTRTETIRNSLGLSKIVRAMPNTPCAIGLGMTVWLSTPDVNETELNGVTTLFGYMGDAVRVMDESFIDMATALTGSGPAFVYLAMEAMVDAGVHMGFPRDTAVRLVQNTFHGTGAYAIHSPRHLVQLRNDITSPGGTTATALFTLEKGGLRATLTAAVFAAHKKAQHLGNNRKKLPDSMASGLSDDSF